MATVRMMKDSVGTGETTEEAVSFVQARDEMMIPWTRLLAVGMERGGHM